MIKQNGVAHVLALESQPLALELYALLRELDPVRWRDDLADQASVRLQAIADALHDLAARFEHSEEIGSEPAAGLWGRICGLADELEARVPSTYVPGPAERRRAWMAVRTAVAPRYEQLALALRAEQLVVPSLRPTNYTRNLFHVAGALIAFFCIELLPASWLFPIAASIAAAAWTMEISRRVIPAVNPLLMRLFGPVAHPSEEHGVNSSTWYATALTLVSLLGEPAACAMAVIILGTADPLAAIFGRRFGTIKLVNGRSLQGSLVFLFVAILAGLAVLNGWHPELPGRGWLALAAAVPATVAELFSRRVDDNFSIPLSAALGAWGALLLLG